MRLLKGNYLGRFRRKKPLTGMGVMWNGIYSKTCKYSKCPDGFYVANTLGERRREGTEMVRVRARGLRRKRCRVPFFFSNFSISAHAPLFYFVDFSYASWSLFSHLCSSAWGGAEIISTVIKKKVILWRCVVGYSIPSLWQLSTDAPPLPPPGGSVRVIGV